MTTQSTPQRSIYHGKTLPLTMLPDESVLLAWGMQGHAEELIVTTHRVQLSRRAIGRRWKTNIMLESLTSCALEFRSHIVFIILAVVSLIGGLMFMADEPGFSIVGIVLGLLFAILYARSRGQIIEFTTAGATIRVRSSGRSLDAVRQLVETVEAAKNARYVQRFSPGSVADTAA